MDRYWCFDPSQPQRITSGLERERELSKRKTKKKKKKEYRSNIDLIQPTRCTNLDKQFIIVTTITIKRRNCLLLRERLLLRRVWLSGKTAGMIWAGKTCCTENMAPWICWTTRTEKAAITNWASPSIFRKDDLLAKWYVRQNVIWDVARLLTSARCVFLCAYQQLRRWWA